MEKVYMKNQGRTRNRRDAAERQKSRKGNPTWYKGMESPAKDSVEARKNGYTFSNVLRDVLTKKRKYRKPDGTMFDSCELELIVRRAVKELRTGPEFDVRLFDVLMNRIEGKPKEPIDVEGIKEVAHDLNAHDIILSRLGGIVLARGHSEDGDESESGRGIGSTVRLDSLGKN